MKKVLFALAAAVCAATLSAAVPKDWTDDFEAAQKRAEKESKPMLVLFTGSDWCPWCVKLEQEIVSRPEFAGAVPKEMVTVFLDFPMDKSLVTPERLAKNRALRDKYGIRGYPTVLLMDAKGVPFAQTGYRRGGPADYVKHLRELVAEKGPKKAAK